MTDPNRNALWGRALVEELVRGGCDAVCIAPGSRSTPLTVACYDHDDLRVFSHLDERSAAYFALGRGKRTGRPTPLICTSGTAAANFHPAVVEADRGRVPLVVLTADRPSELQDSGANQTVDQLKLYGDAVRWFHQLPEPAAESRTVRSLRTSVGRALAESTGTPAGPVHLNVPMKKPLEPTEVPGDVPESFARDDPGAADGRHGPFVGVERGTATLDEAATERVARALEDADRGLVVCGPTDRPAPGGDALAALADATGFPVFADPLSGVRFGPHVADTPVFGGYDAFLDERITDCWPDPDVVLRFGASPTSKPLRRYLARADARQFLVDPAGGWREATFTATDLLAADPVRLARDLSERVERDPHAGWHARLREAEDAHWDILAACEERFEGGVLSAVVDALPDPATLFVSNSMPVRDLDRFGAPSLKDCTVLANRGASGIDGVTSTALGAGSATDDPLVFVTGDLAYYHDTNGLLALRRCDVDATIVEVNNDGGGIFHMLPIEDFDPPFTEGFRTPHGLDFEPTGDLYDLDFERTRSIETVADRVGAAGAARRVVEYASDAEASHRTREALQERLVAALT